MKTLPSCIHVIRLDEKFYMTSAEISGFFPGWKNQDLLVKMLKYRRQKYQALKIHQRTNEELFEQCIM